MMPKLSICGNNKPDPIPFIGLHGLCAVLVMYIYMPNSIILLNTSDSIGLQQSPMHDSNGV